MSTVPPKPPEPTEIAGRYEVVQKLGAGAFGTVFKAKDRVLGRMLAIKTIKVESLAAAGASYEEMLNRFKREAQISAKLKHPNIVTIYDIGDSDGMSYLAMEFIDGEGLDKVIPQGGRLSLERTAAIGAQVAAALDFAHRNSVVHRDIKPANIMIEAGDRVKVTDFGIARATDSVDHLTMTGSLLGTPSYMSPEQARGSTLDGRSDIFSLGCVLYEMIAGHKAFRGESITALIFKIITEEPPSLREVDPSVPDAMLRIVAQALAKTPESRYQTAGDLSEDLLALTRAGSMPTIRATDLGTTPVKAAETPNALPTVMAPPTMAPPPPHPVSAHAARPGAARQGAPPPARVSPPTPTRGGGRGLAIAAVAGLVGLFGLLLLGGVAWWFLSRGQPVDAEHASVTNVPADPIPSPLLTDTPPALPAESPEPSPEPSPEASPTSTIAAPSSSVRPPGDGAPSSRPTQAPAPVPAPPTAHPQVATFAYLDEEAENEVDGKAAGEALARGYGSGKSNSGYGTSRSLRARPRSPENLRTREERAAVATIRHIIGAETRFALSNRGRYASLRELHEAGLLLLDVSFGAKEFQRRGYRFTLEVQSDGFRVFGSPQITGLTALEGDDTGFIRRAD